MGAKFYPIPAIYLHLVAVMNYMSLKQTRQVQDHLLAAWAATKPAAMPPPQRERLAPMFARFAMHRTAGTP